MSKTENNVTSTGVNKIYILIFEINNETVYEHTVNNKKNRSHFLNHIQSKISKNGYFSIL